MKLINRIILFIFCTIFFCLNVFASNRYINMTLTYDYQKHNYHAEEMFVAIDGVTLNNLTMPPIIIDGYTLVPAREVFEAMGAKVDWNPDVEQVIVSKGNDLIIVANNNKQAYLNGTLTEMESETKIINNKVMIPLRFVSNALGFTVLWDKDTRIANIITQ